MLTISGMYVQVTAKRTNVPAYMRGAPRGRGGRGYRGGRGAHSNYYSPYGGGRPPRSR